MVKKKKSVKRKTKKSVKNDLTIHFMPYSEIAREDTVERIKKILGIVLKGKIVILQGKLKPDEEAKLIENSMMLIGNVEGFAGVEIASLSNENENRGMFDKVRHGVAKILVGEQDSITVIGPASVVGEMKKDPRKVELMLQRK